MYTGVLPHQTVAPASPERWCLVLHGILGSKTNWRTVIRRVAAELPAWGFVLPDLRNHGEAVGLPAPHTLDAVAADLDRLAAHLGLRFDAAVGHSYGAKAALAWTARAGGDLDHCVLVDGNPGARPDARGAEATVQALDALAELRGDFDTREAFTGALAARGFSQQLAAWMAMNLSPHEGRYRLRTDVAAVRAMLDDYFARDLWPLVESPPGHVRVHALVGGRSSSLDAGDRERLAHAADALPTRVRYRVVEDAGHWVHVDAPDATVALLVEALTG